MVGTQLTLLAALYKKSTDGTISAPLPMNRHTAAATIRSACRCHTCSQEFKPFMYARASVFAPVVTLPLVQPADARFGSEDLRHASVRVDEVPAQRHGMRVLRAL